ncbi:MAG: ABC transporter permease [Corticimicrobacter sp.]|uniref:ABC transporter permease n=1 Tax=Corticimicrobacter sp. TaxID=2678536 RepID=UPI0032D9BBD3
MSGMPLLRAIWREGSARVGLVLLLTLLLIALAASWLGTIDPATMDANYISVAAGTTGLVQLPDGREVMHTFLMGSDTWGRDIWSRTVYGTRVSLLVGAGVAALALALGGVLGMAAGYVRRLDGLLMRFMDGLMAIPPVLFAIALVAALGASLNTVIVAIAVPEIPRVARLTRAMTLRLRGEPYVEAAQVLGTSAPLILSRHILPNAWATLLVQGTFVAASAVMTEAILGFLGLGLPADIPTWGSIMADGRVVFMQHPGNVLFPALFLVPAVLGINLLGDGLRDALNPQAGVRSLERS